MPDKNIKNGQRKISQAEYNHYCFIQEPFAGFVEGIGYTCTEVVVTAQALNKSSSEFIFNVNFVGYTFDMSDIEKAPLPNDSNWRGASAEKGNEQPDRSNYWLIPTMDKFKYSSEGVEQILNPIAFVDNVAIEIINTVVNIGNAFVGSGQVLYNEGASSWWDFEWGGFKNQIKGIGNWFENTYDYHTQTPAEKQWSDFKNDMTNIEKWEQSTALGVTLFSGGSGIVSKAGTAGKAGMLGEPSITILRGVNTDAGMAYNRALNGVVKPRGGILGHSNPHLHNAGQTVNSRLTSWTISGEVAESYALRSSGKGLVLQVTVPISRLIKSPNKFRIKIQGKVKPVSESETLLKGKIKNATIREIEKKN